MATNVEIKRYSYHFWSSRDGVDIDHSIATISLYDDTELIGIVQFYDELDPLPPPEPASDFGVRLFYRIRELPAVIDMLRNEKPVRLQAFDDPQYARLRTGLEPVGEGEVGP
ncbi:MAG: hypothetical protein AB7L66_05310 [Gemmatimonadales bacterium]